MTTFTKSRKPSNSAIITTAVLIAMKAGDSLYIQNLGTNPLFVNRGTGASSSFFNYVLSASTVADNGTGGVITIADFVGDVSFAGTAVRYMAWKR